MSNFLDILKQEPKVAVVETKSVNDASKHKPDTFYKFIDQNIKKYDGLTAKEWAEHYGISLYTVYEHIKKYGKPPKTLKTPDIIDGKTAVEWAKHYGISPQAIRKRIKNTGSPHPEDNPTRGGRNVSPPKIFFEGKSLGEWAEYYGMTKNGIQLRIKKNGHPHPDSSCRKKG